MYLISVYPITQLPQHLQGPFSYFTKEPITPGAIVEIIFNKKKIPAFVDSAEQITSKKLSIKTSSFPLKKIQRIIALATLFHPLLLEIAKQKSAYYLEPVGSILKSFVPTELFSQSPSLPYHIPDPHILYEPEPTAIIGSQTERLLYYDKIIREAFARNKSVALFASTSQVADYLAYYFKDLPKEIIVFHGNLSKQQMRKALLRAQKRISPSLIIGTAIALAILNGDESTIIIEDAESRHYTRHERPRIPMTGILRSFAKHILAQTLEGKTFPSLEDMSSDISIQYLTSRIDRSREPKLIDMMHANREKFTFISDKLRNILRELPGKTILFTVRKGFYSFVICTDCGYLNLCPSCKKPLSLRTNNNRRYVCNFCKREYPLRTQCQNCGSWSLKGYGIGTERVASEVKYIFPGRPCWILDEENTKTKKDRERIIEAFLASEDGILVATEMVLENPILHADIVAVVAMDNLFSIPEFRMNEQILSLLSRLAEKAAVSPLIIQSRFPKHPLFRHFINQDIKHLLEGELEERKKERLPPYTTLVRIAIRSKNQKQLLERTVFLKGDLGHFLFDIESYPSFEQKEGPLWARYLLLTIDKKEWEEKSSNLKNMLLSHAAEWDIAVDPPSIL